MDRVSFLTLDTVCGSHRPRSSTPFKAKPILMVVPAVSTPKPKPLDFLLSRKTRCGRAPRLQHLHYLRWMGETPGRWFSVAEFMERWSVDVLLLRRQLGHLYGAMLIDRQKDTTRRGNCNHYRITQKGADTAEVGLAALQYAIYRGLNKHG